jgi:hypothetical protein
MAAGTARMGLGAPLIRSRFRVDDGRPGRCPHSPGCPLVARAASWRMSHRSWCTGGLLGTGLVKVNVPGVEGPCPKANGDSLGHPELRGYLVSELSQHSVGMIVATVSRCHDSGLNLPKLRHLPPVFRR